MVSKVTKRISHEVITRLQTYTSEVKAVFTGEAFRLKLDEIIYDFKKENPHENWVTICDEVFGGKSHVAFEKSKHGQCVFKGNISTTLPPDDKVRYSGFCAVKSKPILGFLNKVVPYDLEQYDTFEIRLRGDGRTYFFNIHPDGYQNEDLFQSFIITRGGPHWETIRIPYNKFITTNHGYLQDSQMVFHKIRAFGFSLSDKKNGPFNLELDYIRVIKRFLQPVEFPHQEEEHWSKKI